MKYNLRLCKTVKKWLTLCLLLAFALPSFAKIQNEPDSVYLFSYSKTDGTEGLKFAWSLEGTTWFSIADGMSYVSCDFGSWGNMKRMFNPHLVQTRNDGQWHCIWELTKSGQTFAYTKSPNLLEWKPQIYFDKKQMSVYSHADVYPTTRIKVRVGGSEHDGWMQRVAFSTVRDLQRFADYRQYRQQLNSEHTSQDNVRFAGLKPIKANIVIDGSDRKSISSHLIGVFFEDINYAADGGLYAELVQNRDFEYSEKDMARNGGWGHDYAWTLKNESGTQTIVIATDKPLHENNAHYAVLNANTTGVAMQNTGYDGITLSKGARYDFSLFARVPAGCNGGKVNICLLDEKGKEVACSTVSISSTSWRKYKTVLTANADVKAGVLSLQPAVGSTFHLDMISLFPQNTFRKHKNGLRADLAQTLADLKPRFVRFPGGCVAHGNGIDNMYDWKGSIGPLESRKPLRNIWGYHQTRGLGYFEYFQFCEDIGAEPVPVLAAGVPCQNSSVPSSHSVDELTTYGQQGGISMDRMPEYIQDVLDLIEYANGDARKTVWGRKRAEAGHPQPFNMKFIGIGNEDMITAVFEERFAMIYKAVKEKYPEITVIGTVGPFNEGSDYIEGWRLATELGVPMVDEHYYVDPGWMINNQDYYDRYDRNKSKVYLGEYAAHLPGRPNNIETALAEALYLTAVERNADIVTMASYAPLLAKDKHTQWNPNLIYFNNSEVRPTVGYYTQQMYGQNAGTEYIASSVELDNKKAEVGKRVGISVVYDDTTGDYILKLVNMLPVEVSADIGLKNIPLQISVARKTVLSGKPADRNVKSVTSDLEVSGDSLAYTLPAYSFTVIRLLNVRKPKK